MIASAAIPRKNGRFLLIFFIVSHILTACSLINSDPVPVLGDTTPFEVGTTIQLTCSQACARHNLCGTTPEQTQVILANSAEPMAFSGELIPLSHDLFLSTNQTATVLNRINKTVQIASAQSSLLFYQVLLADNSQAGWVAGYCIAAP